ncbi:MAG: nucleotidyltransferase family protein [bacterium]|nr:nucleotidyltransferase family protein [bacterium]
MIQHSIASSDAFILCGGKGTRLRSVVSEQPKVLAEIGGRPFLDILLEDLFLSGFRKIHLGVGYMKEYIIDRYRHDPRIIFSEEEGPLGTGGAIKRATPLFSGEHVLVMNGDSFCAVDYGRFYDFHLKNNAFLSIVLAKESDRADAGNVAIDGTGRITSFREKSPAENGERFINAGIYLMRRDVFKHMPAKNVFSIEHDFFPNVLEKPCYGFVVDGEVMDIGTPERYWKINEYFNERFEK